MFTNGEQNVIAKSAMENERDKFAQAKSFGANYASASLKQLLPFDPETGRRCIENEHRRDFFRCKYLFFSAL